MAKHTGLGRGLDALIPDRRKKTGELPSEGQDSSKKDDSSDKREKPVTKKATVRKAAVDASGQTEEANDKNKSRTDSFHEEMTDLMDGEGQKNLDISEAIEESENQNSSEAAETLMNTGVSDIFAASTDQDSSVSAYDSDSGETILRISLVEPNREQPRKKFRDEALKELADSIKKFGVIQPLLVQKKDGYYEIIAGERRWRAAQMAGLKEIPAIIKEFTNQEAVEISLIENIQREDLNPIEEAKAYKRLVEEFHLNQENVADRVSKSRTAVTNSMRLLKLDERVQKSVMEGELTEGHARTLLAIPDQEVQFALSQKILKEHLSVRQTEKLVHDMTKPILKTEKKKDPQMEAVYNSIAERLKGILGTKVEINRVGKNKGRIEIEYYSEEELERIYDLLQGIGGMRQ